MKDSYLKEVLKSLEINKTQVNDTAADSVSDTYSAAKIEEGLAAKSDVGHTHDDRYYTETEVDTKLSLKEPTFSKNTGFNKNLGTTAGTVSEGNHTHAAYAALAGANFTGNIRWTSVLNVTTTAVDWTGQNIVRLDATSEEASVNLGTGADGLGALVVIVAVDVTNGASISGTGGYFAIVGSPISLTTVGDTVTLFADENAGWIIINSFIQ